MNFCSNEVHYNPEDIVAITKTADGKLVWLENGTDTGRPIYEFTYNGEIHKVAITVGNNGFIVGANPK